MSKFGATAGLADIKLLSMIFVLILEKQSIRTLYQIDQLFSSEHCIK
jgi:hypothetical protein